MLCPHCQKEINIGLLLGSRKSEKKANAARLNGMKGGHPKKSHSIRLECAKNLIDKMAMKIIDKTMEESLVTKPWENIEMENSNKLVLGEKCASPYCQSLNTKKYQRATGDFWLCDTHKP